MPRGAKSRMRRTETPKPIWMKFCVVVDIPDIVTYTNFGDYRLRGFWVAGGQISPSPIDFHLRPYNTLALPCERVIETTASISTKFYTTIETIKWSSWVVPIGAQQIKMADSRHFEKNR